MAMDDTGPDDANHAPLSLMIFHEGKVLTI
jgi:hypothetical protein